MIVECADTADILVVYHDGALLARVVLVFEAGRLQHAWIQKATSNMCHALLHVQQQEMHRPQRLVDCPKKGSYVHRW
jgi:hypothetical protein